MWKPTVSVVMCTYNGGAFLAEQIASVLAQTYPLLEFLIFDDGSTDDTTAVVKSYCAKHPFIKLFQNPINLGYNKNFEQALKAASGDVIAPADQDDYWLPQKIEKMIAAWNPAMLIIHCDSQRFSGTVPETISLKPVLNRFEGTDCRKLFFYNSVNGHALLIQRNFLPYILPFEKKIYYDWWTAVVASCNGGVAYLNETLVLQRLHQKNVSVDAGTTTKQRFARQRDDVHGHLKKFATAPNMKIEDKELCKAFYNLMSNQHDFSKKMRLLFLIIAHRKTIFYLKQKSLLSNSKHAWFWVFR